MAAELHHTLNGPPDAPVVLLSDSLGTSYEMWAPQYPALSTIFAGHSTTGSS